MVVTFDGYKILIFITTIFNNTYRTNATSFIWWIFCITFSVNLNINTKLPTFIVVRVRIYTKVERKNHNIYCTWLKNEIIPLNKKQYFILRSWFITGESNVWIWWTPRTRRWHWPPISIWWSRDKAKRNPAVTCPGYERRTWYRSVESIQPTYEHPRSLSPRVERLPYPFGWEETPVTARSVAFGHHLFRPSSSKDTPHTSWRPPEDLLKTSWRPPEDLLKTSWRPPEDIRLNMYIM